MKENDESHDGNGNQNKKKSLPAAKISHRKKISLAWIAPFLAILLAAFLVYKSLPEEGVELTIHAKDGSGIDANSTLITYRGVRVGIVHEVTLNDDLGEVILKAELEKSAEAVAREKTKFWIVRPEISVTGVKGLETIVTGPYITFRPGDGGEKFEFEALSEAPREEEAEKGLHLRLTSGRIGGIKTGTPVLYRDLIIGEVYDYQLAETASFVNIFVIIREPYQTLVRQNSVFWNSGGFNLKVSLLGAKITSQSLKGILIGGISLATPDKAGEQVRDNAVFELHAEQEDEWTEWSPKIKIEPVKSEMKSREEAVDKEGISVKNMLK